MLASPINVPQFHCTMGTSSLNKTLTEKSDTECSSHDYNSSIQVSGGDDDASIEDYFPGEIESIDHIDVDHEDIDKFWQR